MRSAGIFLHHERADAAELGRRLAAALRARGIAVVALAADAARLKDDAEPVADFSHGVDLVFVLGGDGTFLRAAEAAAPHGVALLGVNLGRIGFLAALEPADLDAAVDRVAAGVRVSERMTLDAEIAGAGGKPQRLWALNDVSVVKLEPGRLISLALSIGGEPLTTLAADGVVVATPTGSTAYSFSAGGPIVAPDVEGLVVTPISPHLVFDRSVVAAPGDEIAVRVMGDPDAVAVSADGRPWLKAAPGSTVLVRRSPVRVRMADVDGTPFWRLVRTKFKLP